MVAGFPSSSEILLFLLNAIKPNIGLAVVSEISYLSEYRKKSEVSTESFYPGKSHECPSTAAT